MRITRPSAVLAAAVVGAAAGLVVSAVRQRLSGLLPVLTAGGPVAALLLALALGLGVAYMRARTRPDATPPDPHVAVRLLMLGKAATLVGALVAGAYLALGAHRAWVQRDAVDNGQLLLAGVGAVAGVVLALVALWLERSCRRADGPDPRDDSEGDSWPTGVPGGPEDGATSGSAPP